MTLVTAVVRGWRWGVLLRPVAPHVSLVDATLALSIGYAVNLVSPVPRAGEGARALSLKWTRDANISAVLGTIVVERVIDVLWLILLIAASAALLPGQIDQVFPGLLTATNVTLAFTVAALSGMFVLSAYRDRGDRHRPQFSRPPLGASGRHCGRSAITVHLRPGVVANPHSLHRDPWKLLAAQSRVCLYCLVLIRHLRFP